MCDFRSPPKVINVTTGEIVATPKDCRLATYLWKTGEAPGYMIYQGLYAPDIKEPGLYFISATGAYYAYFDGNGWHNPNFKLDFSESHDIRKH